MNSVTYEESIRPKVGFDEGMVFETSPLISETPDATIGLEESNSQVDGFNALHIHVSKQIFPDPAKWARKKLQLFYSECGGPLKEVTVIDGSQLVLSGRNVDISSAVYGRYMATLPKRTDS